MTSYPVSPAPHIRASDSVAAMMWKKGAALLPAFIALTFLSKFEVFKSLGFSIAGALAAEGLAAAWLRKKNFFQDFSGFLQALIYIFLISPALPYWMIFAGAFFGLFLGREVFGGLGSHPLPPALLAFAVLQISFPEAVVLSPFLSFPALSAAIFAGGIFLISQKWCGWQTPVSFLGVCAFLFPAFGTSPTAVFSGEILFAAFFLVTDLATLPLTKTGRFIFTTAAAFLLAVLKKFDTGFDAVVFSILIAGLLPPWIDRNLKPKTSAKINV